MRTDFATWDRKVLEKFAREASDENLHLKARLETARELLSEYRKTIEGSLKNDDV